MQHAVIGKKRGEAEFGESCEGQGEAGEKGETNESKEREGKAHGEWRVAEKGKLLKLVIDHQGGANLGDWLLGLSIRACWVIDQD